MFRLDRKLDLIFKIHNVGMMKNGVDLKIDASTSLQLLPTTTVIKVAK